MRCSQNNNKGNDEVKEMAKPLMKNLLENVGGKHVLKVLNDLKTRQGEP